MNKSRRFIHIHGQQPWCIKKINSLLLENNFTSNEIICCGFETDCFDNFSTTYLDNSKSRSEIENNLGTEYSTLLFNCFGGFNPDLFCALVGLIRAPGIIILVTPQIETWPDIVNQDYSHRYSHPYTPKDIKSRYIKYLTNKLKDNSDSKYFSTIAQSTDPVKII